MLFYLRIIFKVVLNLSFIALKVLILYFIYLIKLSPRYFSSMISVEFQIMCNEVLNDKVIEPYSRVKSTKGIPPDWTR